LGSGLTILSELRGVLHFRGGIVTLKKSDAIWTMSETEAGAFNSYEMLDGEFPSRIPCTSPRSGRRDAQIQAK
jgi:hypothetical protein